MQWAEPSDNCSVYNFCGMFATCSINNNGSLCKCLPGFKPTNPDYWRAEEFSGGCSRKSDISCNQNATRDTFFNLTSMILGEPDPRIPNAKNEEECKQDCLRDCQCQAYSYIAVNPRKRGTSDLKHECRIWTSNLAGLQKDDTTGLNLSVRVAISDLERTRRDCRPCGLNSIQYPLSTQPDCGDPLYSGFSCEESTGDLRFQTLTGSYLVTDIDFDTQRFVINVHMENSHKCRSRDSTDGVTLLKGSFPFNVTNWCYIYDIDNLLNQIEIGWNPPPEPTCSALIDCEDWPNSICNATKQRQGRCQCKSGFKWDALSLNCTSDALCVSVMTEAGLSTERKESSLKFRSVIIFISVILALVIFCSIGYIIYKRNLVHERKDQENDLFTEDDKKAIDIPFFSLEIILAATDSFSDANKLGQGGFGPVYKVISRLSYFEH
nr:G-type lectin S-receptor-like serine/threonine-protein kinase [Ipomoea batatas]